MNKEKTYFKDKNGKLTMRNTKPVQPEFTETEKERLARAFESLSEAIEFLKEKEQSQKTSPFTVADLANASRKPKIQESKTTRH